MHSRKSLLASLIAAGLSTMAAGAASAQQQQQQPEAQGQPPAPRQQAAQATPEAVEQIVVTANRREQYLQDVPVAVTAVSGATLEKSNIREATDLQYLAPSVSFSGTNPVANGGGYQIRGVGTQTFDSGVEQTVGLVVDGVVIGLSRDPGATGFSDIDRVEVLRGPQGTLFGKNSSAGVIHIITKLPKIGLNAGDASVSFGERNETLARGTVNLATGDSTALRVSGFYQKQDGPIPYVLRDSGHVGDRENKGIRAKFLWNVTDRLSALVTGEHQEGFARDGLTIEALGAPSPSGSFLSNYQNAYYNNLFATFPVKPGHGVYLSFQNGDSTAETKVDGASLKLDYLLGEHTLTSITAYRKLTVATLADIDASPANILDRSEGGVDSKQITQELRLTSPSGEPLEYVLGAYYYKTENNGSITQVGGYYDLPHLFVPSLPSGFPAVVGGGRRDQFGTNESVAAFGQGTYELTGALKLIAGLRYTRDSVTGSATLTPLPFPAFPLTAFTPYSAEVKAENVSGRAGLQYQLSKAVMLYGTYSRGYKGPAISGGGTSTPIEVRPETVDAYELGARTTMLDGRMTLNATLFSSDFKDFQAQTFDLSVTPPAFALSNAGLMRTRGVELETSLRVTQGLDLSAAATYNDARFVEFLSTCYTGQSLSSVAGQGCYLVDPTKPATSPRVANYAGERLPNAPKWSYILRASYRHAVSEKLMADASANWAWRSQTQAVTADPRAVVESYGLLNGNIGLGRQDGGWRVGLYGRNLLDKRFYAPYPGATPGNYYRVMSPDAFRTLGVNLSVKF